MLHAVVDVDLTVVAVVTTVILEVVIVLEVTMDFQGDIVNPQRKEMFQGVVVMVVAVALVVPSVVVDVVDPAMKVVMVNVLEGHMSVVAELAEGQSLSVFAYIAIEMAASIS